MAASIIPLIASLSIRVFLLYAEEYTGFDTHHRDVGTNRREKKEKWGSRDVNREYNSNLLCNE